ncbi:hypothetical protein C8R45DRAFT_1173968 [Mycena sanguinolenta]|nr:hypothetical protein C8R45DRAFT_1173968 [Mycena sanguinolenta]
MQDTRREERAGGIWDVSCEGDGMGTLEGRKGSEENREEKNAAKGKQVGRWELALIQPQEKQKKEDFSAYAGADSAYMQHSSSWVKRAARRRDTSSACNVTASTWTSSMSGTEGKGARKDGDHRAKNYIVIDPCPVTQCASEQNSEQALHQAESTRRDDEPREQRAGLAEPSESLCPTDNALQQRSNPPTDYYISQNRSCLLSWRPES